MIVVCEGFRCLGYLDSNGVWRDDARGRELSAVKGWIDLDAYPPVPYAGCHRANADDPPREKKGVVVTSPRFADAGRS